MVSLILRFLRSDDGATAVEYAVMLALIILVCFGAVILVGHSNFDQLYQFCRVAFDCV